MITMKPTRTRALEAFRRSVARYVWGNRAANACSDVLTGRVIGGSSW